MDAQSWANFHGPIFMSQFSSDTGEGAPPQGNVAVFTVGELSLALKRTVEETFGRVRVRGEISGFTRAHSGHLYFALKDADSVLDSVCWKGVAANLAFKPEDGMEVICTGRISTYSARSKYQIIVDSIELAGEGALLKLIEERKKRLEAEGLFAEDRKRPLPYLPDVIGVVSSPTGAVIRDILHRLADRFPRHVLLWPVAVQGEGAAEAIAAAIEGFNRLATKGKVPRPDVLIVARGGGSIEDLMAFNEERVVRAAAASKIPLISAVGHETDITLIDFVSDRRAPTPTAAAEIAVPVRLELLAGVLDFGSRQVRAMHRLIEEWHHRIEALGRVMGDPMRLIEEAAQRLDDKHERLLGAVLGVVRGAEARFRELAAGLRPQSIQVTVNHGNQQLAMLGTRLAGAANRIFSDADTRTGNLARRLESVSYKGVLARGYAVVRHDGSPVTMASETKPAMALGLEFQDGSVEVTVEGAKAGGLLSPPRRKRKSPTGEHGDDGGQGSLL